MAHPLSREPSPWTGGRAPGRSTGRPRGRLKQGDGHRRIRSNNVSKHTYPSKPSHLDYSGAREAWYARRPSGSSEPPPTGVSSKGFDTAVLLLEDGQVRTGVLKGEDAGSITIAAADGQVFVVPKAEVRERAGGVSAMPEDAARLLTSREIRDLVELLARLR